MKIMISYFYQIRFFKPNMIPLSTAKWDPKWFHQNKNQDFQFKDKNGVWNGLRADPFAPGPLCEGLCSGLEKCQQSADNCLFLSTYKMQLRQLDFQDIYNRIVTIGKSVQEKEQFSEEPIVVLIVHESPENNCSERKPIQEWFQENGYILEEFIERKKI